ncbi:MAG TPA: hypothetical protein VF859_13275 [Burkholderiales bacterium]
MREQVGEILVLWQWNVATAVGPGLAVLVLVAGMGGSGVAMATEPVATGEPARPSASSSEKPSARGAMAREVSTRRRAGDAQTAGKPASSAGARSNEDGPTMCDGSRL